MQKMDQKSAVYNAVKSVLGNSSKNHEDGQDVSPLMSKELRAQVNQILFEGFKAGKIELGREYTDAELKTYISGVQSNWIRKDKRLNGGVQYAAKNPGSRTGSTDPQIKAMKALQSTLTEAEDIAEVQAEIDRRTAELKAEKVKVTVDFAQLPESLRSKFGSQE